MKRLALSAAFALLAATASAAEVIGVVDAPDGRFNLYAVAEFCVGNARRVGFVGKDGAVVKGCWVANARGIFAVFLDAEFAILARESVRKPERL